MFTPTNVFSSFSVNNLAEAKAFYGETLGLAVADGEMGMLRMRLPGGAEVLIYPKDDHQPASFTMLNFVVDNVEATVDELNELGIRTKIYQDSGVEGELVTDAKGIMRGHGPEIAWFKDPAGNVRAKLRSSIKRLLVINGYPPDKQPEAIKLVMEQMEAMAPRHAVEREASNFSSGA